MTIDQQRFTIRSGLLTGNDTRWRSASSSRPLPERTLEVWTPQSAAITDPPMPQLAFTPQCSPATTHYF